MNEKKLPAKPNATPCTHATADPVYVRFGGEYRVVCRSCRWFMRRGEDESGMVSFAHTLEPLLPIVELD